MTDEREDNRVICGSRHPYPYVSIGDEELTVGRSLNVARHSPTGFEWGYGGSGPAQLALAILLEVFDDSSLALRWCQALKGGVVRPQHARARPPRVIQHRFLPRAFPAALERGDYAASLDGWFAPDLEWLEAKHHRTVKAPLLGLQERGHTGPDWRALPGLIDDLLLFRAAHRMAACPPGRRHQQRSRPLPARELSLRARSGRPLGTAAASC